MKRLFLSHAEDDQNFAAAVGVCLSDTGLVTIDQMSRQIVSASDWSEAIRSGVEGSDAALFLVTPNYVDRPWFFIEWAGAWILKKPPHILLIETELSDLPEVMRERQVTRLADGREPVENLVSALTGLPAGGSHCVTLADALRSLAVDARSGWAPRKWSRILDAVTDGRATLARSELDWILATGRVTDLVSCLRNEFAHPTLVHQVAQYLVSRGDASKAMALADLLTPATQSALFSQVLSNGDVASATLLAEALGRETRRDCALRAARAGLPDLTQDIATRIELSNDKRAIAQELLNQGFEDQAVAVVERADKNYDKRIFAADCVRAGRFDIALRISDTLTVSTELRRLGEMLVDHGRPTEDLDRIVDRMDRNYEKRNLAIYALRRGDDAAAATVANRIQMDEELQRVARAAYEGGKYDFALRVLLLMTKSEERRSFIEYLAEAGEADVAALGAQSLSRSRDRRILAEVLSDAGRDEEALSLSDSLELDAERAELFWFAVRRQRDSLAARAAAALSEDKLRRRFDTILAGLGSPL